MGFFILEKQLTNILDRGFLFLRNTLLLHIPLLALTDGQNYGGTNTLAARGLEELFFQLSCLVSFWFWREIGFGLHTYVLRVPYSCGVVSGFLVLAGNSFWYVRSPYSCGVVVIIIMIITQRITPFNYLSYSNSWCRREAFYHCHAICIGTARLLTY